MWQGAPDKKSKAEKRGRVLEGEKEDWACGLQLWPRWLVEVG